MSIESFSKYGYTPLPEEKKDVWKEILDKTCQETDQEDDKKLNQCRAYLNQFLVDLYDELIINITVQFNLLNKAVWMILIGFLLITGLMLRGYGLILLAGAVGGLLSRLQRVIFTKNLPTDYSVYWALFSLVRWWGR